MQFSPSEWYWLVLQPSSFALMLLALALVLLMAGAWRASRGALLVGLGLIVLPALLPVRDLLAVPLEQHVPKPLQLPGRVDGIIVLGGAVDWRVTQARRQLALNEAAERLVAGAALARAYPDARLVLTGIFGDTLAHEFRPDGAPHTFFAGDEFVGRRPIYVGDARSTYEDALLSLQAIQPRAGETWLLVTSALHMPRALAVFQSLGWNVTPYPVDYTTTGRIDFRPSPQVAASLVALDGVVREWGALVVYSLIGRTESLLPEVR